MIKSLIFSLCLMILTSYSYAAPIINNVSGTINHNASIIVSGSNFGTKSPAAPLLWDDCENKTINSNSSVISEGGYTEAWPYASNITSDYKIAYRSIPKRNVTAPHVRSTKYIAGGHEQVTVGDHGGRNVMITKDSGAYHDKWFVMFYERLDPLWPACGGDCANYKSTAFQSSNVAYTGSVYYTAYTGYGDLCSKECGTNSKVCGIKEYMGFSGGTTFDKFNDNCIDNPKYKWNHLEHIMGGNLGFQYFKGNNTIAIQNTGGSQPTDVRSYTIGGFYRYNGCDSNYLTHDNAWRYFDDIYIDTTLSRVMLCSTASYPTSNTAVCEPQIPSVWNNSSITAKVNLGALSGNRAYLYVFDSNNNCNATGYPVTIGGGDGATTTVPDSTPPAPPSGLTIE